MSGRKPRARSLRADAGIDGGTAWPGSGPPRLIREAVLVVCSCRGRFPRSRMIGEWAPSAEGGWSLLPPTDGRGVLVESAAMQDERGTWHLRCPSCGTPRRSSAAAWSRILTEAEARGVAVLDLRALRF